jgi:hypothetical protein
MEKNKYHCEESDPDDEANSLIILRALILNTAG